eukprot:m.71124 g.71124  ORF g.71124 m.71124 type:complete len:261 (+) comp35730_c0_seq1:2287-3069(+)
MIGVWVRLMLIAVALLEATKSFSSATKLYSTGQPGHKPSIYSESKGWDHEKPRLSKTGVSESPHRQRPDAEKVHDSALGGCPKCQVHKPGYAPNFSAFCDVTYDFALEVMVKDKSRTGYSAKVVRVYKNEARPNFRIKSGQVVNLAFPISSTRMSINRQLAHCSCPALQPRTLYVVFGHFSHGAEFRPVLKSAIEMSSTPRKRKRSRKVLRDICKRSCDDGSAEMPSRSLRKEVAGVSDGEGSLAFKDPFQPLVSNGVID